MMIRQAIKQDAEAIVQLIMLAIGDIAYQQTGYDNDEMAAKQLLEYVLQPNNRFSLEYITVVEMQGELAGMMLCYTGDEEDSLYAPIARQLEERLGQPVQLDKEAEPGEYYIDAIAVFPSFQGMGIASQLLQHAEDLARKHALDKTSLNVDIDNERAFEVYVKKGYRETKQIIINRAPFRHMIKLL